jgi:hypothetical protein
VAFPDCALDTGSHLTTIPSCVWQQLRPGVITPLPFDPAMPQHRRTLVIGGSRFPDEWGELTLPLEDKTGGRLNIPITLGLSGGCLDGRALRAEPDPAALRTGMSA